MSSSAYERAPAVQANTNAKAPATNTGASSGRAIQIGRSPGASSISDTVTIVHPQKQFKPNASDTNPRTGTDSAACGINLITPSITPTKFEDGCLDILATAVSSSSAVSNNNDHELTMPSLSIPSGAVSHHARSGTINPSMTPAGQGHPEPSFWTFLSTTSVTPTGVSLSSSSLCRGGCTGTTGTNDTSASTCSTVTVVPQGFERINMLLVSASITERVLAAHHDVPPSPPSPPRRPNVLYVSGEEEEELNQLVSVFLVPSTPK